METAMRHLHYFLLAALTIGATTATAADFKVIANPGIKVTEISANDLKEVFLATKTSLSDGSHVEPVWEKGGATHEAFLKEYVGKTDAAVGTYYRSLVFTGKASMPKTLGTDAEVVAYVEKTKGAIGYVSAATNTGDAKVLDVK
jgi:ABC-type phosphate transport system substrate-binding protein